MIEQLLKGVIGQDDILNHYNATINYEELPCYINGMVHYYKGIYIIIINKSLSYYKRKKAILHELAHIELNQLCQCNKDLFEFYINQYEDDADHYIKLIKESLKGEKNEQLY